MPLLQRHFSKNQGMQGNCIVAVNIDFHISVSDPPFNCVCARQAHISTFRLRAALNLGARKRSRQESRKMGRLMAGCMNSGKYATGLQAQPYWQLPVLRPLNRCSTLQRDALAQYASRVFGCINAKVLSLQPHYRTCTRFSYTNPSEQQTR